MITVQVGRLPGSVNSYVLNDGATASDALAMAGITGDGYDLRVNDRVGRLDQRLASGDSVLLVKKVKGNSTIEVFVGRLPGRLTKITLNGGRSVREALAGAGLSVGSYEIRVDTAAATLDTQLRHGQTVVLVTRIKGNA